jgi:hypothetical protein
VQTTFGVLRVTLRYSYARGGTIYFQRAIPDDLRDRYPAKLYKANLGTNDVRVAAHRIEQLNRELEAEWALLRASPKATPKTIKAQAEELLRKWGLSPSPADNDPYAVDTFYGHLDTKRERYAEGDEHLYRQNPVDEYLDPVEVKAAQLLAGTIKPTLNDALELYLKPMCAISPQS